METNYREVTTTTGRISAYGFSCGYCERHTNNGKRIELYMDGNTYHVRMFDDWKSLPLRRVSWDVFDPDQLKQARKRYNQLKRQIDKNN